MTLAVFRGILLKKAVSVASALSVGVLATMALPVISVAEETAAQNKPATETDAPPPKTRKEVLQISPDDIVLGNPDAPVTVIEYASMSCGHCAAFHMQTFPQIKENYIETGKVRMVFRDFPLNSSAVFASQIARCAPKEKFYDYVSALFASQSQWMSKDINKQLLGVARLGGMTKEEFDDCIGNKESARRIMESRYYGHEALDVSSTPTFFINDIKYEGGKKYEFFSSVFDKLIAAAAKTDKKAAMEKKEDEKAPMPAEESGKKMEENSDAASDAEPKESDAAPAEDMPKDAGNAGEKSDEGAAKAE